MRSTKGTEAIWFVSIGNSDAGPFTKSVILEYLANGDLTFDDLCWRDGFPDWIPLGRTLEFAPRGLHSPDLSHSIHKLDPPSSAPIGLPYHEEVLDRNINLNNLTGRDELLSSNPSPPKNNYFTRHWRGELSLPQSYWLNTYLLTLVFALYLFGISSTDFTTHPKLTASLFISFWVMLVISQIWLSVGIIRSARKYSAKYPRKSGWGAAAMLFTVIGFLSTASAFFQQGIPQITGFSEIISAALHKKEYSTRLLRNLTEIELTGPLDFGVSADLEAILNEYPTLKVLHLNSWGGRLAEADKLKDIVLQRKLDTYVGMECQSACVTVFVAGQRRLISKTAVIGLHEPYFPGLDENELAESARETKSFFYSRGIKGETVEKGFSTKHDEMWNPSHEELFASGIATEYAQENDVGLSGIKPSTIDQGLEFISKISLYAAIKEKYPTDYTKIETILKDGLLKGRSMQEMRVELLPLITSYYGRSIPTASLKSIEDFFNLIADQQEALLKISPSKCVSYIKAETTGYNVSDLPAALTAREMIVGTEVIRSTGSYSGPLIEEEAVQESLVKVISQASALLGLAEEEYIKGLSYELDDTKNCKVFISYFRGLTNASALDKPKLLRYSAQLMNQ